MATGNIQNEEEVGSPRRWLILFAMTGSLAMILLDVTVVGVSLPQIRNDLQLDDSGPQTATWVMNAYTLAIASLIALGGRLSDSIGRVRCFVLGVITFAIASVACGMAQSGNALIAARVAQGIGAALMQPSSSTIVISSFAPGERGKAMGVYIGIPMVFLALGPLIGGVLTEYASWRASFFLNIPVAILALALTAKARPTDGPRSTQGFDPRAALLYLAGLPAFVFALQQGSVWGWRTPAILWPLIGGFVLVVLFTVSQWRRERPLLAVRLFEDRPFLGNGLVLFCMQFAMTGQVIFMSEYFQGGLELTPSRAGAALMPMLLPVLIVVHVAGRMYDRGGARAPVLLGTALATIGLACEALLVPHGQYIPVAVGMFLFGAGIGFTMSPTNTDALSRVGPERRGQASGLLGTLRQVAASLGIAVSGAAVLMAQQASVRSRLPVNAPEIALVERAAHGDTSAIAGLADNPALRAMARSALMDGTAAGHWVACVAVACAFVVAFIFIPRGSPRDRGRDSSTPGAST
ncbi:MAG: MFS transporter [Phycisphaerae bacterium]|nr:MFS transporter [Phycisphaerae bacterium]